MSNVTAHTLQTLQTATSEGPSESTPVARAAGGRIVAFPAAAAAHDPRGLLRRIMRASDLEGQAHPEAGERLWTLANLRGRITELSSPRGPIAAALFLVREALAAQEPVAWVSGRSELPHPPDLARWGLPLDRLPVIRAGDTRGAGRAAGHLMRSGGFGLIVIDLGPGAALPQPQLSRLHGQAQAHDAVLLAVTEKPDGEASLGSLVSLRCASGVERVGSAGRFVLRVEALKDKRRAPGWRWEEVLGGPTGLR